PLRPRRPGRPRPLLRQAHRKRLRRPDRRRGRRGDPRQRHRGKRRPREEADQVAAATAASADKTVVLRPPRLLTLELALEFIEDDELVEVTPDAIRLRKRALTEADRRRAARAARV